MNSTRFLVLAAPLLLAACATAPSEPASPSIMVLPGAKKSLQSFKADEDRCRFYAEDAVAGRTPGEAAADTTVRNAAVGTALGAGAGAIIGSTAGHVGTGAAVGAASGLLLGTATGAQAGERSAAAVQRRYDIAYAQCMTSAGNKVEDQPAPRQRVVVYESDEVYYRPAPPVVVYGGTYRSRW